MALIHSARLIENNPILYTYGMPRTFTISAMSELASLPHYRHVNENDAVPSVPPERELDNHFYKLWGPLGSVFGYSWSVVKTLVPIGSEVFCHHGEVVHFFKAQSVQEWQQEINARSHARVRKYLPLTAKLFLVPCLSDSNDERAKDNQQELMQQMDSSTRDELFPKHSNPKLKSALKGGDHPSGKYAQYIGERVLELVDSERFTTHQKEKDAFMLQMQRYAGDIRKSEQSRDTLFLGIDTLLGTTLQVTQALPNADKIMQRYGMQEGKK